MEVYQEGRGRSGSSGRVRRCVRGEGQLGSRERTSDMRDLRRIVTTQLCSPPFTSLSTGAGKLLVRRGGFYGREKFLQWWIAGITTR